MTASIDPAVRAAALTALNDPTDQRSRAQLARALGVSTRTVSRWAEDAGLVDPFTTRDTRAATEAATDRRRALRSDLADKLLLLEVPRLHDHLAGTWERVVVLPGPDGAVTERVREDDATIARALKELHVAIAAATRTTIDIDKHDVRVADDDQAGQVLGKLFDGLGAAYRVLNHADPEGSA